MIFLQLTKDLQLKMKKNPKDNKIIIEAPAVKVLDENFDQVLKNLKLILSIECLKKKKLKDKKLTKEDQI